MLKFCLFVTNQLARVGSPGKSHRPDDHGARRRLRVYQSSFCRPDYRYTGGSTANPVKINMDLTDLKNLADLRAIREEYLGRRCPLRPW